MVATVCLPHATWPCIAHRSPDVRGCCGQFVFRPLPFPPLLPALLPLVLACPSAAVILRPDLYQAPSAGCWVLGANCRVPSIRSRESEKDFCHWESARLVLRDEKSRHNVGQEGRGFNPAAQFGWTAGVLAPEVT